MASLAVLPEGCGRAAPVDGDYIGEILSLIYHGQDSEVLQYKAVSKVFLEPAGIPWGSFWTWNEERRDDIHRRNPQLVTNSTHSDDLWLLPRKPSPYPIIAASLVGPECAFPIDAKNRSMTVFESTPLYVGTPNIYIIFSVAKYLH
jgi:hypothetical protein